MDRVLTFTTTLCVVVFLAANQNLTILIYLLCAEGIKLEHHSKIWGQDHSTPLR